jgi:Peptidase family M28
MGTRNMKVAGMLVLALCAAAMLVPAVASATPTYDQAVNSLIAKHYPQTIESHLNSLGTSPLGMRWAGSASDNAAARYLRDKMLLMGLKNVRLEKVPLDVFQPRGASVTVDRGDMPAWKITCSQFAGVPPTPTGGISGEVVYVGTGTAAEYEGLDVTGKIVLIDLALNDIAWLDMPAQEATVRGAKAVIYTFNPDADTDPYYSITPDAFGSNDGLYGYDWAPCVYMPWRDGEWLKAELKRRTVSATVVNDVKVTLQKDGGFGYNVVGEIPGKIGNGQKVVVSAHHDAHFRAGMDDTSGTAGAMLMAKAMRLSGYRPNRTVVFMLTTAEEFGNTNAYWDFLTGSWYSINNTHKAWPGKVAAQINLESQGGRGGEIGLDISKDLNSWATKLAAANPSLTPNGISVGSPVSSWTDAFPFNSAGIPAMTWGASGSAYAGRYHTNYDVQSLIDWTYFGKMNKLEFRFAKALDKGLLPYSLGDLADDIASTVDKTQLEGTGADAATVAKFTDDVAAFQTAAAAYDAGKASIPAAEIPAANASLMQIEKKINKGLLSLGPDDDVMWAHQQLVSDLENINKALAALEGTPDPAAAKDAVSNMYLMWYGLTFSEVPWQTYLAWHDPGWIGYGTTANVVKPINALPAYKLIDGGDYAGATTALTTLKASEVSDLNARLAALSAVLEEVTPQIQALL